MYIFINYASIYCLFSENQLNLDKLQKMQEKINTLEEKLKVVKEEVKRKAEGKC